MIETKNLNLRKMGRSSEIYGKLNTSNICNASHKIWLTRFEEPEDSESFGWSHDYQIEPNKNYEAIDLILRMFENSKIDNRESETVIKHIVFGETLEDIGGRLGVSRERVRQIVSTGLRKLRQSYKMMEKKK